MNSNPLIFTPVQGTDKVIQSLDHQTGWLYFATDTGKMYLDNEDARISVGGGKGDGISMYYGSAGSPV